MRTQNAWALGLAVPVPKADGPEASQGEARAGGRGGSAMSSARNSRNSTPSRGGHNSDNEGPGGGGGRANTSHSTHSLLPGQQHHPPGHGNSNSGTHGRTSNSHGRAPGGGLATPTQQERGAAREPASRQATARHPSDPNGALLPGALTPLTGQEGGGAQGNASANTRTVLWSAPHSLGGKDRKELRFHNFGKLPGGSAKEGRTHSALSAAAGAPVPAVLTRQCLVAVCVLRAGGNDDVESSAGSSDAEEPQSAVELALEAALAELETIPLDNRLLQVRACDGNPRGCWCECNCSAQTAQRCAACELWLCVRCAARRPCLRPS